MPSESPRTPVRRSSRGGLRLALGFQVLRFKCALRVSKDFTLASVARKRLALRQKEVAAYPYLHVLHFDHLAKLGTRSRRITCIAVYPPHFTA